jgi:hypothetical protein
MPGATCRFARQEAELWGNTVVQTDILGTLILRRDGTDSMAARLIAV